MNSEKPTILKIEDAQKNILEAINESDLPVFLLLPIIEKIYSELLSIKEEELNDALKNYESSLELPKRKDE